MKVYMFKEDERLITYLGAFLDPGTAKIKLYEDLGKRGEFDDIDEYHLTEYDLPFVGRHVYILQLYNGYDYDYDDNKYFDVIDEYGPYSCKEHCKQSEIWVERINEIESSENKDDYIVEEDGIGYKDDLLDTVFLLGDVIENKWSLTIDKVRVNKTR